MASCKLNSIAPHCSPFGQKLLFLITQHRKQTFTAQGVPSLLNAEILTHKPDVAALFCWIDAKETKESGHPALA